MPTRRKKEWFDDDSFWRDLYSYMFPPERFEEAPEQAGNILALTKPPGKSVLDLCCGPGRYSVAFAKKGFRVTGVDRTKFLLDKARALARSARVKIEWVQMDMRDFVRPDSFDLVLSTFTSFGYFDNKDEDIAVLENMQASLRPGGVCLIDVMGKERLTKIFLATTSDVLPDGALLVQRHEFFDDWSRMRNEWILLRGGRAKTYKFHHTVYSGQELKDRFARAGFVDVKLYGSLSGDEFGPGAKRLVAVGRKRKSPARSARW